MKVVPKLYFTHKTKIQKDKQSNFAIFYEGNLADGKCMLLA